MKICDHCDQAIGEDERLYPVFVGSRPAPKMFSEREILEDTLGRDTGKMGEYKAMMDLLESIDGIDFTTYGSVRDVTPSEPLPGKDSLGTSSFDSHVREDVSSAEIRIDPREFFEMPDPDMKVCEYCRDNLRS